jgi:hypothetical protein
MAKSKVRFRPSYRGIGELMRSDEIRGVLPERALPIAARARTAARAAGEDELADSIRTEQGTRPRGRPYARIIADHGTATAKEFGDEGVDRLRIIGQAANVQVPK